MVWCFERFALNDTYETITEGSDADTMVYRAAVLTAIRDQNLHADAFLGAVVRMQTQQYLTKVIQKENHEQS